MATVINILLLAINFGRVVGDICYSRYYPYSYYCSGYCTGGYGYEYCNTESITVGAIAGIIIGSLIFLGIVISVIVAICCSCIKTNGTRGRVVHPVTTTGGVAVVQSHGTNYYGAQPTAPPYAYSTATYGSAFQPNPQIVPPPPPTYSAYNDGYQPPPYPPTTNNQPTRDEHVQQPPLSTSADPLSSFNGPNQNLYQKN